MRPIYLYGIKGFDSCEICDELITEDNPGKEVSYEINGRKFIAHVCNDCFACYTINGTNHFGILLGGSVNF